MTKQSNKQSKTSELRQRRNEEKKIKKEEETEKERNRHFTSNVYY